MDQKSNLARQKKKSLRNSLFSMVAFAFVTIIFFSAQTYAYFTDGIDSQQNKIASGTLDVELIEMRQSGTGETAYVNPVEIMPATEVSKIVKVKNTGTLPVYIRIRIEKDINKQESELPENWESLITCDFNLDNIATDAKEGLWTYLDGYYYYNEALEAGKTTVPLFEHVFFSADMGNEFTNSEIFFTVRCEAAQVNGNADSPMEATGWPVEQNTDTTEAPGTTETPDATETPDTTETPDATETPEGTDAPAETTA